MSIRICATQNPACTGITPCEGCHNIRAQALVAGLTAAGYTDRDRMTHFFEVLTRAGADAAQYVESQLRSAYAQAAEETLAPLPDNEPIPDTEFPPRVEEEASEEEPSEPEPDMMGPLDPSQLQEVMRQAKEGPEARKPKRASKKLAVEAAEETAESNIGDEQHG